MPRASIPHTPSRTGTAATRTGHIANIDHEAHRRDVQCGMDPGEIAVYREDELQERRDRRDEMAPFREWGRAA